MDARVSYLLPFRSPMLPLRTQQKCTNYTRNIHLLEEGSDLASNRKLRLHANGALASLRLGQPTHQIRPPV
jgi:hypothetical protein